MKRNLLFYMLSIVSLIAGTTAAQTTKYSGNLVKISMLGKTLSLSDTLGRWLDYDLKSPQSEYVNRTYYYGHITLPKHSYLLKQNMGFQYNMWFNGFWGTNYIEAEGQNVSRGFSQTGAGWDVIPPYFIQTTQVTKTAGGSWLINGALGNAFIDNNDSLFLFKGIEGRVYSQVMEENLVSILGRVGDRYLGAFIPKDYARWGNNEYEYRLMDLSNSPHIGANSPLINFYGVPAPGYPYTTHWGYIKHLYNDLYIAQEVGGSGPGIFRFADTSFNYVKPLILTSQTQTNIVKDEDPELKYHIWEGFNLYSYDLNLSDTTFGNKKAILEASSAAYNIGTDRDFRYLAKIDGDTLRIFDIEKESYINAISIKGVKKPSRPIVDSPYVYLHQTTFEEISSDVNEKENSSIVKSYSLSAYPNPFNPVTTLEFNIPAAGQVELKIYDVLGKEVTTLVNEYKKEGGYKVQFNAASLPSGIYLCRMSAGKYSVTKKIVLLK